MSAVTGLVVAAHGRRGIVEVEGRHRPFVTKGRGLRIVCGDRVRLEARAGSEHLLVTALEPRANVLARAAARDGREEILAANLTQLVAVCAPVPEPDWFLADRYACAAELAGCRFALAWNKADLVAGRDPVLDEYMALGYPVLAVSARGGAGLDVLRAALRAQVSVLVGQSGVGKSSLINALAPGATAAIGELSAVAEVGTHTTTASLMYTLDSGGRLVDTPGVRDFVPAVASRHVDRGFPELRDLAPGCRFADCSHLHEPGCAVKAALGHGRLSARRYASYRRLIESLDGR